MGALTFLILAGILSFLTGGSRDGSGELQTDGHLAPDALVVKGPAK